MYDHKNRVDVPITQHMLLEALKLIRDDKAYRIPAYGICNCAREILVKGNGIRYSYYIKDEEVIYALMAKWPKHSGDKHFPIRGVRERNPLQEYTCSTNKWDKTTKYGKLRWELLNWLINELEKEDDHANTR